MADELAVRQPAPPVDPAQVITRHLEVPKDVAAILDRACRDCHSNETRWPLELNLSDWAGYDRDTAADLLTAMCRRVRTRDMPLRSCLRFHPATHVADDDIAWLCAWTSAERRKLREAD